MYDPRYPNVYSEDLANEDPLLEARLQRQRAQERARQLDTEKQQRDRLMEAKTSQNLSGLTADELVKRRLEMSAKIGIDSAQKQQQEEVELKHRQQKMQGEDKTSKLHKLMSKLGGGGSELSGSLTLASSGLAAGGHSIVETAPPTFVAPGPTAKAIIGKPSTVLRLINVATETSDPALEGEIAEEARQYGHVKKVLIHKGSPVVNPEDGTVSTTHPPYVFIQFDTIANGFKAAEAISGKSFDGRKVEVAFYPKARFDEGQLEDVVV